VPLRELRVRAVRWRLRVDQMSVVAVVERLLLEVRLGVQGEQAQAAWSNSWAAALARRRTAG